MSYQLLPWKCKYFPGLLEILTFHHFLLIVQDVCFFFSSISFIFHFISEILAVCTCVHNLNFTPFLLHQFLSSPSSLIFGPPMLAENLSLRLTPSTTPLVHSHFFMPIPLHKVLHKILKVLHKISHETDF